jgi:hypothetical protein
MPRTRFIEVRGATVLLLDFSRILNPYDVLPAIAEAKGIIARQPPDSLLLMTDVTGSRFNPEIANALKEFAAHNRPYVRKAAIIGLSGLQKLVYRAVLAFTGRTNLRPFATRADAEPWLTSGHEP